MVPFRCFEEEWRNKTEEVEWRPACSIKALVTNLCERCERSKY